MSPSCCNTTTHSTNRSLLWQFLQKASESAPWLSVGLVSTVLLQQIKLPTATLQKLLSLPTSTPSLWHLFTLCFWSSLLGLATPLCSCGAIPLAISFATAGASPAAVVSFLTAAQSAGLDSAAITYGMLGWETATFRLVGAVVLSVGAGMAVGRIPSSKGSSKGEGSNKGKPMEESAVVEADRTISLHIKRFITSAYGLLDEIWFVLAIGIFVSVVVQHQWKSGDLVGHQAPAEAAVAVEEYIPQPEWWDVEEDGEYPAPPPSLPPPHHHHNSSGMSPFLQDLTTRVTVIVGALPFQLCEHGVVSFASALHKSGATHGTAHAFLLTAPATNIATLGAVLKTTGDTGAALRSAVAISALALLMSYGIDHAWEADGSGSKLGEAVETLSLPDWWSTMSVWVCGGMVGWSCVQWGVALLEKKSGALSVKGGGEEVPPRGRLSKQNEIWPKQRQKFIRPRVRTGINNGNSVMRLGSNNVLAKKKRNLDNFSRDTDFSKLKLKRRTKTPTNRKRTTRSTRSKK